MGKEVRWRMFAGTAKAMSSLSTEASFFLLLDLRQDSLQTGQTSRDREHPQACGIKATLSSVGKMMRVKLYNPSSLRAF